MAAGENGTVHDPARLARAAELMRTYIDKAAEQQHSEQQSAERDSAA
jgi:hypothetical protein